MQQDDKTSRCNLDFVFVEDLEQVVRHKLAKAGDECRHLVSDTITEAPLHHQPKHKQQRIAVL